MAQEEEASKDLALKSQQMQAAIAHRERELLLEAGAPTAPTGLEPLAGPGKFDDQGDAVG